MAIIWYKLSDMMLQVQEGALYLSGSRTCTQSGGNHYLRNNSDELSNIGNINTIWKTMRNVMGSAADA